MKKNALFIMMLFFAIGIGTKTASAENGPTLKFDPPENSSSSTPESQPDKKKEDSHFVYGKTPIAKFGNDQTYFKLGGYGAFRFEYNSGKDVNDTFTFRRFVLTTDAKVASRLRVYAEIEFERFRKIEV